MFTRSQAALVIPNLESAPPPAAYVVAEATENDDEKANRSPDEYKPLPSQFDEFIPWACTKLNLERCKVTHQIQEDYIRFSKRKFQTKVNIGAKFTLPDVDTISNFVELNSTTSTSKRNIATKLTLSSKPYKFITTNTMQAEEPSIPLTTIYNTYGDLVEISIIKCKRIIPQKFIKLIKLALPFHKFVNKLTIGKGGLTQETIFEINEMLPYTKITQVCLDDNYVKQGNYYVLLDTLTSLKILSLCRCSINEFICEDIVKRLQPGRPGDKLQSLSLSTNFIGNNGACKFGDLLRRNRNLLHLNLADNEITYEGAAAILASLKEFKLNEDEIFNRRRRKLAYEKKKIRMYDTISCNQVALWRKTAVTLNSYDTTRRRLSVGKKDSNHSLKTSRNFQDVFCDKHTVKKNDQLLYCTGNLRFCYLNLAFNDLDDRIPTLIRQVLTYQSKLSKPLNCTGLLKLVIEGNPFSKNNAELLIIQTLLMKALPNR